MRHTNWFRLLSSDTRRIRATRTHGVRTKPKSSATEAVAGQESSGT